MSSDASTTQPDPAPQQALDAATVAILERLVDEYADGRSSPGLAYGVVLGGDLVHSGGRGAVRDPHGPAAQVPDADTVFRIASMTKSFTAAAVLLLRDRGHLGLDDEVAAHVPEAAAIRPPSSDAPALTVRALLTMAGGLPSDDPWGDRQLGLPAERFSRLLGDSVSLAWTPGTAFEYSNLGYALLGRVIEAVTGREYREALSELLLEPLGLVSTAARAEDLPAHRLAAGHRSTDGRWEQLPLDPYGSFSAMGGLFSTVRDLTTWVGGFTDAYPPRSDPPGDHPLSRATRRELQQPHRSLPVQLSWTSLEVPPAVWAAAYGYGLFVELDAGSAGGRPGGGRGGGEVVGHSGGLPGFGSHMRWHPASGWGVIVLANSTYAPAYVLATRLLRALLGAGDARAFNEPVDEPVNEPVLVRGPAPAPGSPWPATLAARALVERLLHRWDDALAAELFAPNVDLDEPLPRRRAAIERMRSELGGLEHDPGAVLESLSPAHLAWWVRGTAGRAHVEVRLAPQQLVQTLTLTAVPDAPEEQQRAARALVDALGAAAVRWPPEVVTSRGLDAATAHRRLLAAAAWAGPATLGEVVAADGPGRRTWRVAGRHAHLHLTLAFDTPAALDTPDVDADRPAAVREIWFVPAAEAVSEA